jgi:hypothetical protein
MPGPARFQRRGDPSNKGFSDVGHKRARLVVLSPVRSIASATSALFITRRRSKQG